MLPSMDALQFIAAMTKALAWPLVALVAIILFRNVIGSRIGSILKISHGKTAVEFDHAAKQVEAVIAAEKLPATARPLLDDRGGQITNIGRIVAAWSQLEEIVRRRLLASGESVERMPGVAMLRLAQERGVITLEQLKALLGLNAMRNLAAHGRAGEIDEGRVEEFLTLADAMSTVLAIADQGRKQGS